MDKKRLKILESLIPTCAAILAVVVIEIVALMNNIDGTMLALSYVVVGGLGGYKLQDLKKLFIK